MESVLLKSLTEPFSIDVPPLDFIINNHINDRALFSGRFDPLNNDYFIGFWLAIFCATLVRSKNEIHDVLFGILDDNRGFKSLTIVPNGAVGGKNLLVIRNFYFTHDHQQVMLDGLSVNEREQISHFINGVFKETVVQYLVYDINSIDCVDQHQEKTFRPYVERVTVRKKGDVRTQVEVQKFYSLKHSAVFVNDLYLQASLIKNRGQGDSGINKMIQLIKEGLKEGHIGRLTQKLQEPFEFGFIHGFYFSTFPVHGLDVKIRAYGREEYNVSLILQEKIFIDNMVDFTPMKYYQLSGTSETEDVRDDFKQKVFETIAEYGGKDETGAFLKQHIGNWMRSLALKQGSKDYIANYLRGMFMTWPGPSYDYDKKSIQYDVYRTNRNRQLIIRVQYKCILIFSFDSDTLDIGEFISRTTENCIWLINISEYETDCSIKFLNRDIVHGLKVTKMDFKTTKDSSASSDNIKLFETHLVRSLVKRLDFSDLDSLNDIYHQFKHIVLASLDVLKRDKASFSNILEGLFHDTSSYFAHNQSDIPQIEKFYSKSACTLHIHKKRSILQINFMSTSHIREYIKRLEFVEVSRGDTEYKNVNFFYHYDQNSGNFSVHMKVGIDFQSETFTFSTCYDSATNEIQCPPLSYKHGSDETVPQLVPEWLGTMVKIFEAIGKDEKKKEDERNELALQANFTSLVIDDLRNPFYILSDLIWTQILIHDSAAFVNSIKATKTAWKLTKITTKAMVSSVGVPILGLVLATMDWKDALANYRNGDTSSFALYSIVAAGVFATTSLASLTIGLLTLMSFNVIPAIGWMVFAVGTVFFLAGHIWKINNEPEAFKTFLSSSWEDVKSIPSFLSDPIAYLESELTQDAARIVNSALEMMENFTMIQNIFSTPICKLDKGQQYGCHDVYINFEARYSFRNTDVLSDTPSIPRKFAGKYKKLCAFQTALGVLVKIFKIMHDPFGEIYDYECVNALAVGRITGKIDPNPVSLYILHGNSSVHAVQNTANIFRLSGGQWCRVVGGHKENNFIFLSSFRECRLVGNEHSINMLDVSGVQDLRRYKISDGKKLEGVNGETNATSIITIDKIGTIITKQNFDISDFTIFCSNISFIVTKRTEDQRLRRLYFIRIANGYGCPYNLDITSYGNVVIENLATRGRTVFIFPDVTGTVDMFLNNNRGRMTHSILWKSINITDIRNFFVDTLDHIRSIYKLNFMAKRRRIILTLQDGTDSTQQIFADGTELTLRNDTFVVDMLFSKSKGQLWDMYNILFESFGGYPLLLNAYSERDDEFFVFTRNTIQIDKTVLPFSFFKNRQEIGCKSGYNVIFVTMTCCNNARQVFTDGTEWFQRLTIRMLEKPDTVVIDLTHLIHSVDQLINKSINFTLDMSLTHHLEKQQRTTLNIHALFWNGDQEKSHLAGTILFEDHMLLNSLYKNIKITARSNFIFDMNVVSNRLEVVPLPHHVSPFSPIVVLDRYSVQKNQDIIFSDRLLINFDLVKLSPSTLLITDMASNMAKSHILNPMVVPLLSIVIKNYKHNRMQTLTLKFENGVQLKVNELNETEVLEYEKFHRKLISMNRIIKEQEFSMEHDSRFKASYEDSAPSHAAMKTSEPATTTTKLNDATQSPIVIKSQGTFGRNPADPSFLFKPRRRKHRYW